MKMLVEVPGPVLSLPWVVALVAQMSVLLCGSRAAPVPTWDEVWGRDPAPWGPCQGWLTWRSSLTTEVGGMPRIC